MIMPPRSDSLREAVVEDLKVQRKELKEKRVLLQDALDGDQVRSGSHGSYVQKRMLTVHDNSYQSSIHLMI